MDLKELGVPHFGEIYLRIPYPHGTALSKPLLKRAQKMGCRTIAGIVCVDLLLSEEDQVVGMLGIHVYKSKMIRIRAKTTVLATGGAGEMYKRNDTTANTTGDGFAIAYRAGAPLRDMEFFQFEPYIQAEHGLPMLDRHECEAEFYGILKNKNGDDFLQKYIASKTSKVTAFHEQYGYHLTDIRELVSRAMATEVNEGRGDQGAVLFDLRHVEDGRWKADIASQYTREVLLRGFDVKKKMLHVFPGAIHSLGGISIDNKGRSGLKGLFAAGECTGGVHGAARLGGDGLVDPIVFGARAGCEASLYAKRSDLPPASNESRIIDFLKSIMIDKSNKKPRARILEIRERLQALMWDNVSILRNGQDLEKASVEISALKQELMETIKVDSFRKMKEFLEVRNMLLTASFVTKGALQRKESRGGHFRTDYPYRDDRNWLKNIFIKKNSEGNPQYTVMDVDDSKYATPEFSKFGLEVRK